MQTIANKIRIRELTAIDEFRELTKAEQKELDRLLRDQCDCRRHEIESTDDY